MSEILICAGLVAILVWSHLANRCKECGHQLYWVNPKIKDMPLVRCFHCHGPHPAYIKEEFHDKYTFQEADDE